MHITKTLKTGAVLGSVVLALISAYTFNQEPYKSKCSNENHIFKGKGYVVNLCATGYNMVVSTTMRLQVYSKDMELLADRTYELAVNEPPAYYKEDKIEYLDINSNDVGVIEIPPTAWDRFKAKLP